MGGGGGDGFLSLGRSSTSPDALVITYVPCSKQLCRNFFSGHEAEVLSLRMSGAFGDYVEYKDVVKQCMLSQRLSRLMERTRQLSLRKHWLSKAYKSSEP